MQTILASKVLVPDAPPSRIERQELPDGDFIDLALSERFEERGRPIVALFHGLAGCVHSSYVRGAFRELEAAGFRVALMHWRGCSGEPNRRRYSYHSGASHDIGWFVDHLATRCPGSSLHALGYSLGANALIKYLGEQGEDTALESAVAVCPPLVLATCADRMNRGLARAYQRYLLGRMRKQHETKRQRYPELDLPPADQSLDSFWSIDERLTAPLHGFSDAADYYRRSSGRQFLPKVRIPLHLLCARDDPFFTESVLPSADELAPSTRCEISDYGGHVGFVDSMSRSGRWLDRRVAQVLRNATRYQRHAHNCATLSPVSP